MAITPDLADRSKQSITLIEKLELFGLNLVAHVLKAKFKDYVDNHNQIRFHDLLLILSRQGEGRAKEAYNFTIADLVSRYLSKKLDDQRDKELRCRIAACPLFNVALERFVAHSLISWLVSNNIPYKNCHLPTSADFAILLEDEVLPKIYESLDGIDLPEIDEYKSILLSVDAKSVMGLSNLGDALTRNNILGKFEAKWNQLSYIPPKLRDAMASNDDYFNKKYSPIGPLITLNGAKYLFVSIFVSDLVCLPDMSFFNDSLESLNGSYFNDYCTIVTTPNGLLQSGFYDSFFTAGKGGYSDGYPVDCRFQIMHSTGQFATFKNLSESRFRFRYLNPAGKYNAVRFDSSTRKLQDTNFLLNSSQISKSLFK